MAKRILFLTDPIDTLNLKKDTSLLLMEGFIRRGYEVYYLPKNGISIQNNTLSYRCFLTTVSLKENKVLASKTPSLFKDGDVHGVFIRTDPPFNLSYLAHTWLLDMATCPVLNSPKGIRHVNEKIWATQFKNITPITTITQNKEDYLKFLAAHHTIILKPTDGFGGSGIFKVQENDPNKHVIFETLLEKSPNGVILQPYIADADKGDKRIILLNGEPLGAILRKHASDDHRNNFFAGGSWEKTEITANDAMIIEELKPHLKKLNLYFVGIDIIGDYLIEVNVTSPTCLQEMNQAYNAQLEDHVVTFFETL